MIRGLYTAASAMMMDVVKQDTIANNLANVNTTGYKRHNTLHKAFQDMMMSRMYTPATPMVRSLDDVADAAFGVFSAQPSQIGILGTGSEIDGSYVDHSNGAIRETENPLDVALQGKGFFVVEGPNGFLYTRNGAFTLNQAGELVTHEGYRVIGENGPVRLSGSDVEITLEGEIFQKNQAGQKQYADTLQLVDFEDYQTLQKLGSSFYAAPDSLPVLPGTANVNQGGLETANVEIASEMVNMITALRSYEINQKAIQAVDEMTGRTINDVGAST